MSIKVSVIVPVYNPPENYLRECLNSICNQTLKDIEIILIDNAATGNNPQILKEYAAQDKRIKLFRFEENQGFSGACNKGLELVHGEYFQIVDSDDLLVPEALAEEYNHAKKHHAQILIFQHDTFDCNTNKLNQYQSPIITLDENQTYELSKPNIDLFKLTKCAWNKLFNTKFIQMHNISFNNNLRVAAPDVFLSCQTLALAQRIAIKKKSYYIYRQNIPTNVMSTLRKDGTNLYKQVITFVKELEMFLTKQKLNTDKIQILSTTILEILYFNYSITASSNKKNFKKLIKQTLSSANPEVLNYENIIYSGYSEFYEKFCQPLSKLKNSDKNYKWLLNNNRKLHIPQPDVSVIVPVYNHNVQFVRRCFESLHAQTLQNMEIILVNNGASNENIQLIRWLENNDIRARSVNFAQNQGYGKAMNSGLDEANGKYIGIVETDDFIAPNMFSDLYNIAKNKNIDIIKSTFYAYKGNENKSTINISYSQCNKILRQEEATELVTQPACYWTAIYRHKMLKDNNIRWNETPGATGQDVSFILACWCLADTFYFTNKAYYYYRTDNENQSIYKFNTNAWGGHLNYTYLNQFLQTKNISNFCWKIKNLREVLSKLGIYPFVTEHKLRFYLLCSKFFAQIEKNNLIDLNQIFPREQKIYQNLKKHPYLLFFKDSLFSKVKFESYKKISFCFRMIQIISNNKAKKILLFGYPFYQKNISENNKKIKICKIPFQTIHNTNNIRIKKWCGGILKKESCQHYKRISVCNLTIFKKNTYSPKETRLIQAINSFTRYTGYILDNKIEKIIPHNNKNEFIEETKFNLLKRINKNLITHTQAQQIHPITFKPYFACHEGKDVILIGCGPSTNYFTGIKNKIYCGVNRAFLNKNIKLDYLFIQDNLNEDMEKANKYAPGYCQKFYGIIPNARLQECQDKNIKPITLLDVKKANAKQYYLDDIINTDWPYDISREPLRDIAGTTFSALQFILYTQPQRIFLVGCDCTDGKHFYGGHSDNFSASIPCWKSFADYAAELFPNVKIISINPIGLKGLFEDVYTESYLKQYPATTRNTPKIINIKGEY